MIEIGGIPIVGNNQNIFYYSVYVDGIQVATSQREMSGDNVLESITTHVYIPGLTAGQVVEIRGHNEDPLHETFVFERVLTALKVS
jgi:hypothetical protein